MRYIVIARDGTDPEAKARRLVARPAISNGRPVRRARQGPARRGILDEAGDMVGSVVLADFAAREEVDAWVAEDPT